MGQKDDQFQELYVLSIVERFRHFDIGRILILLLRKLILYLFDIFRLLVGRLPQKLVPSVPSFAPFLDVFIVTLDRMYLSYIVER